MKRRTMLLGRCGTTLTSIGLAMLLASLIPQAMTSDFRGDRNFQGETCVVAYYQNNLTPQNSLTVNITANNTVRVYLLETSFQTIYDWLNEHCPQTPGVMPSPFRTFNQICLTEFLAANPQITTIEKEVGTEETILEYTPTRLTNVTVIICNPNPSTVKVDYRVSVFLSIAPKVKLQTLSQITIPFGLALTVPWIANSFMAKREKQNLQS
ncbi:MAG: hypothetical protein QXY07_02730 [Candidatus Bathyarchaeia archaeon]